MPDIDSLIRAEQEAEAAGNLDAIANGELERVSPEEKEFSELVTKSLDFRGEWHSTRGRNGGDDRRERMLVCEFCLPDNSFKPEFKKWEELIRIATEGAGENPAIFSIAFIRQKMYSVASPEEKKMLEREALEQAVETLRRSALDMMRGILKLELNEEQGEDQ